MPLFEIAILTTDKETKEQKVAMRRDVIAKDERTARDKALLISGAVVDNLDTLEILVRPFVQ